MAVFGVRWASIAAIVGGNRFFSIDIERDDELIEMHVERCRDFWLNHVAERVPPPADGSEATREALAKLYKERDGVVVGLDAEAEAWAAKYREASATIKAAEKLKDEAGNHLKAAIGDASVGRFADGSGYSYKSYPAKRVEAYDARAYRKLQALKAPKGK